MKLGWIVASAILLWSNLRELHAYAQPIPIIPDSPSPTPSTSGPIMMEIVLAAEQNEMPIANTGDIIPAMAQVSTTTAESDEVTHTASPLSFETTSAPIPSMSATTSMSMHSVQRRRVAIVMGALAGGIAVLALASMIAMLCRNALQNRRGKEQGRKRYDVKNHEMDDDDEDDDDDIEDQRRSSRQSTRTMDDSSSVQSLDVPPSYSLATNHPHQPLHPSLGPASAFQAGTIITVSTTRSSASFPPAYGLPSYGDAVLAAR